MSEYEELKKLVKNRILQELIEEYNKVSKPTYPGFPVTATVLCVGYVDGILKFLAGKRSNKCDTFPGLLCLPGGFLEPGESLKECAAREVYEEVGLEIKNLDELQIADEFSHPGIDPRGQVINVVFTWFLNEIPKKITCGPEMTEAHWYAPDALLALDMAFNHYDIVRKLKSGKS